MKSLTPASGGAPLWIRTCFQGLVLGVSFFVLHLLALSFVFPPYANAVLWIPGGLSLAFLLKTPTRLWPALLAVIFVAAATSTLLQGLGLSIAVAMLWALGNCLRTLLGAWLIRRFVSTSPQLSRLWEIAGLLLFGGLISPLPSATLGALGNALWRGSGSFMADWLSWWLADGLGTLLVAPLLLARTPEAFGRQRFPWLVELGVLLALTALGAHFIFGPFAPSGLSDSLVYASFPFVLWGALRLGPLGAASSSAMVAGFALWHTLLGQGPFCDLDASPQEKAYTLQLFLTILGLTALMLAAGVSDRRRTEQLQQLLVEAGTVLAASMNVRETLPRVARLIVPRVCDGFALWLVGEKGLLERVTHAGWSPAREARIRGHLPPLPTTSRRWSTQDGTVVLAPLRVRGSVQGAVVFMKDERLRFAGEADLMLAEDLAHRCGMALESARLYAEAQEAIAARNEFIAIAAHELRTPLTALMLRMRSLEAELRRQRSSEEVREKVLAASRQIGRLSQLVERLLDVGRITTGRLELHREQVDVSRLVEQVVESFAEQAHRVGTTLRVEAEAGLSAWWDRGRIEQALINLLSNALKFGAGHPVEVHVSGQRGWVCISVRDQGIGIAPEAMERIFERFERAVSARKYGGLGLGLFLTRQIAESHSGTIHVESPPEEGTTFVLQLPTGEPHHPPEETTRPTPS